MPNEYRVPTEHEIGVFRDARQTGITPSIANLLLVMGVYSVVNRSSWWTVAEDSPDLEIPGVDALKQLAVDLGRHCYLWPGVFELGDLDPDSQIDPLKEWASDGGRYRLGRSNVGQSRHNIKIGCAALAADSDMRIFGLDANTSACGGMDLDESIKLELRFAEGFANTARLVYQDPDAQDVAWEILLRNCEVGSDMAGSSTMLEDGWRG